VPFKSKAQRRWMHAAEARGEVPKGTASRWEHETKDESLPERAMKKEGMFFSEREQPENGEFMKCAQKLPLKPQKKEKQDTSSAEATRGAKNPVVPPPPAQVTPAPAPGTALPGAQAKPSVKPLVRPPVKLNKQMLGVPKTANESMGAADPAIAAAYGTGEKLKKKDEKKKIVKEARADLGGEGEKTLRSLGGGTRRALTEDLPAAAVKGMKHIQGLPDYAKAGIVGGGALYGLGKVKKAIKSVAGKPKPGAIQKMLMALRRLRGK